MELVLQKEAEEEGGCREEGRGRGAALEIRTGNLSKLVLEPVNSITSFLSWRFMSTETTQAYQGQGEEWDWERGPRPTSLFTRTQLLEKREVSDHLFHALTPALSSESDWWKRNGDWRGQLSASSR